MKVSLASPLRAFVPSLAAMAAAAFVAGACGFDQLAAGSRGGSGDAGDAGDGATGQEAGVVGQGCGVDPDTGLTLCLATSMCPDVVVDGQAFPSCGFRVRGSAVDLVCGCSGQICPMGVFATCAEAAQLLTSQTQQAVCVQLAEGRCVESAAGASSGGASSGAPGCDRACLSECGGGAGCASVCGC